MDTAFAISGQKLRLPVTCYDASITCAVSVINAANRGALVDAIHGCFRFMTNDCELWPNIQVINQFTGVNPRVAYRITGLINCKYTYSTSR
jgi:hypothetical protein